MVSISLIEEIKREVACNYLLDAPSFFDWARLMTQPKTWGIILFRMACRGSGIARRLLAIGFHSEIGNDVTVGHSLWLPHPYGIVIAQGTIIGNKCSIFHRTTFAEKSGKHQGPVIGNNCIIGTGRVLLGSVTVGNNVKIGPNSVVISSLNNDVIAYGNPLQIKT